MEPNRWLRTPALALLLCYWAAMVVGTHWPRPLALLRHQSDKLLHLSAYFVLALLVCLNWSLRRPLRWRQWLAVVAMLAAFGALDEVTQIPFGRDANVFDWVADGIGTLAGVAVFVTLTAILRRPQRRAPSAP